MPVDHYENFPVASWLMPSALRPAVEAIYRWARYADDLADEGDAASASRLQSLGALNDDLLAIGRGAHPAHGYSQALVPIIARHALPLPLFHDLLSAFIQDVTTTRYPNTSALLDYSRRSANPIGRLMLHLFDAVTPLNCERSDAICTALQLTNFWQDVAIDWRKGRIYLPLDSLAQFDVTPDAIDAMVEGAAPDAKWQALLAYETNRTRAMLLNGAPLAQTLKGRIGLELRLVVQGGLRILECIDAVNGDVFRHRPQLTKRDAFRLFHRTLRMPTHRANNDA